MRTRFVYFAVLACVIGAVCYYRPWWYGGPSPQAVLTASSRDDGEVRLMVDWLSAEEVAGVQAALREGGLPPLAKALSVVCHGSSVVLLFGNSDEATAVTLIPNGIDSFAIKSTSSTGDKP
jgi:hypothetical protein